MGNRSKIDCAALLFLTVRAVAKGLRPDLSRRLRSMAGTQSNKEMISECWFSIAMCKGVLFSVSLLFMLAPCSIKFYKMGGN